MKWPGKLIDRLLSAWVAPDPHDNQPRPAPPPLASGPRGPLIPPSGGSGTAPPKADRIVITPPRGGSPRGPADPRTATGPVAPAPPTYGTYRVGISECGRFVVLTASDVRGGEVVVRLDSFAAATLATQVGGLGRFVQGHWVTEPGLRAKDEHRAG